MATRSIARNRKARGARGSLTSRSRFSAAKREKASGVTSARPSNASASRDTEVATPQARLLRLLQLASPSLPVGAYSYSEGLEHAVERGIVADIDALTRWLEDALRHGGIR